jgi:succinate dehydrogenase hydrophobic anchor subunit
MFMSAYSVAYNDLRQFCVKEPLFLIITVICTLTAVYHAHLGFSVIIEDYMKGFQRKCGLLILDTLSLCAVGALILSFAFLLKGI